MRSSLSAAKLTNNFFNNLLINSFDVFAFKFQENAY